MFEISTAELPERKLNTPEKPNGRFLSPEIPEPPIRKGEVFDPASVKDILKLPSSKRRAALETYKKRLAYQREGLAIMQADIIRLLDENPNATEDELAEAVWEFTEKYGLTNEQIKIIGTVLYKYQQKHGAVEKIYNENPDPRALYKTLFGADPRGEVEVIKDPITLYFRCHNQEDFTRIRLQHRLINEGDRRPTEEEIAESEDDYGVSLRFARFEDLQGSMMAENVKGRPYDDNQAKMTYIHEKQHATHRLLTEAIDIPAIRLSEIGGDENKFAEALKSAMETKKKIVEEMAKGEIMAFMKEAGQSDIESGAMVGAIRVILKDYNYFDNDREDFLGFSDDYAQRAMIPRGLMRQATEIFFDKIYDKAEYWQLIERGLNAFVKLYKKFIEDDDEGYYRNKIIAYLTREPLQKWPRTAELLSKYQLNPPESLGLTLEEKKWFKNGR